jgi:hypothetical protein
VISRCEFPLLHAPEPSDLLLRSDRIPVCVCPLASRALVDAFISDDLDLRISTKNKGNIPQDEIFEVGNSKDANRRRGVPGCARLH